MELSAHWPSSVVSVLAECATVRLDDGSVLHRLDHVALAFLEELVERLHVETRGLRQSLLGFDLVTGLGPFRLEALDASDEIEQLLAAVRDHGAASECGFSRTCFLSSARVRITFHAIQGEQQRANGSLDRSFVVAHVKARNFAPRQSLHGWHRSFDPGQGTKIERAFHRREDDRLRMTLLLANAYNHMIASVVGTDLPIIINDQALAAREEGVPHRVLGAHG